MAPTLEASGMVLDTTSVGTTRTFSVTVPADLTDAIIVFAVDWFNGTNSTVSSVTYGGSATGITTIGTDQSANLGSGIDGMAMRYLLNPASGANNIVFTFSADQGGQDTPLAYWIYSGVNTSNPINDLVSPNHDGSTSSYNGSLTTTVDNCALGFAVWDFNVSANGSVSGWTQLTPTQDFAEGWSLADAGTAGEKTWTWSGAGGSKITVGAFAIEPAETATNVAVGQATETDTAQSINPAQDQFIEVGQASETDSAQTITPVQDTVVAVGQASETDTAQSINPAQDQFIAVGQASETDTAQTVTPVQDQVVAVGQAEEADTAQAVTPVQDTVVAVGQASETDSAQPVSAAQDQTIEVGQAVETDTAQAITIPGGGVDVGQAEETDTAQAIAPARADTAGQAEETDEAFRIVPSGAIKPVLTAEEADSARYVTVRQPIDGVSILDAWTLISTAAAAASTSYPVSPGANRVLIYQASIRVSTGITITGVTYGGQVMTKVASSQSTDAVQDIDNSIWVLDDTGIAAASGTTFTPSFSGSTTGAFFRAHAASYERVKQDAIVTDTDTSVSESSGGAPATAAVVNTPGGMVIACVANNQGTNQDTQDATWGVVVEDIETAAVDSYTSIASLLTLGSDVTPTLGVSGFQRAAYVAFSLARDSLPIRQVSETDTAFAITPLLSGATNVAVGQAVETDTAQSITASAVVQVQILDGWTVIAETEAEAVAGVSFPVTAGSNRLLTVAITEESSGHPPTAVAYGGQAMTPVVQQTGGGGFPLTASFWILDDAGIEAAEDTDVVVTFDGDHDGEVRVFAGSYENVAQTDTVIDTYSATAVGAGIVAGEVVTSSRGAIAAIWNNSAGSVDADWDGINEVLEEDTDFTYTSIAWSQTDGSSLTPDPDPASANFNNLAVFTMAGLALEEAVDQASETDSAQSVNPQHRVSVGQAAETDTARAITVVQATQVTVGQASEADSAQAVTVVLPGRIVVGQAEETDSAGIVSPGVGIPVGQASETDAAFAIGHAKTVQLGLASETDTARPIAVLGLADAERLARRRDAGSASAQAKLQHESKVQAELMNALRANIEREDEELLAIAPAIARMLMSMRR